MLQRLLTALLLAVSITVLACGGEAPAVRLCRALHLRLTNAKSEPRTGSEPTPAPMPHPPQVRPRHPPPKPTPAPTGVSVVIN
jgi:hypothetical protein